MEKRLFILFIAAAMLVFRGPLLAATAQEKPSALLKEVEEHYRSAKTIKMEVTKLLKMKILQKEKKSEGVIEIKRGGKLRWETENPDHTLVLADGRVIWLVDFPQEEGEKVRVIKAANPRKSQPHAIVAFLMGQGKISDDFAVISEESVAPGTFKLELKPRENIDQVQWLTLYVDKGDRSIEKLSFEDTVGNVTELEFKKIQFDEKLDAKDFRFKTPKDASVTVIN